MDIGVVGGTGRIGRQVVELLSTAGHRASALAPSRGVDAFTGRGLTESFAGLEVVVLVANRETFDAAESEAFFSRTTTNVLRAGDASGVRHVVALSIVGTDRIEPKGYFAGKAAQERILLDSGGPVTLVRSTQFFESLPWIADMAEREGVVRASTRSIQPVASADTAGLVAELATRPTPAGVVEIAGPERASIAAVLTDVLRARHDERRVEADPRAGYLGIAIGDDSLVPLGEHRTGRITLGSWLARTAAAPETPVSH